jgi:DNA-binding NtrC family response regulator
VLSTHAVHRLLNATSAEEQDRQLFGWKAEVLRIGECPSGHDQIGLVEQAAGGTLFLDNVDRLSRDAQTKLLHALENGNRSSASSLNVRVIAATRHDLTALLDQKRFRKAL